MSVVIPSIGSVLRGYAWLEVYESNAHLNVIALVAIPTVSVIE